jgi:DNA topoisomerase-1
MAIAQALYESALISYPRTSSQKLPPAIGYRDLISRISDQADYAKLCDMLLADPSPRPREGSKTDPAHPAIYPTGNPPGKRRPDQEKLYDLICRRFLSTFAPQAVRESLDVAIEAAGHAFHASGRRTLEPGWIDFYGPYSKLEENLLPHLEEGEELDVNEVVNHAKETQPSKRYTQASIIREMERRSLGTKATRALIVQTLYNRGYIRERSIEVTKLGMSVIDTLSKHCPGIISESLTARFENEMETIEQGEISTDSVVAEAQQTLTEMLHEFKENEEKIGQELAEASMETRSRAKEIGPCPKCGETLRFITSRRTGKRFIGCSGYSKGCRYSAPVPQSGKLSVARKKCTACGQPMISVYRTGKRPWSFCFNLECPLKKESEEK